MPEEIRQVTKDLKNNKSPGHSKITNEHIKWGRGEHWKVT